MRAASLYVQDTCRRIEHDAKRGAPVRKPARGEPAGGALRASIGTDIKHRGAYRVYGRVGSRLNYSLVVHKGARRHIIRAKNKRFMSFYWDKAPDHMVTKSGPHAGKVMLRRVRHPGMKGTRYLTVPLLYWGHLRNFKVVVR